MSTLKELLDKMPKKRRKAIEKRAREIKDQMMSESLSLGDTTQAIEELKQFRRAEPITQKDRDILAALRDGGDEDVDFLPLELGLKEKIDELVEDMDDKLDDDLKDR